MVMTTPLLRPAVLSMPTRALHFSSRREIEARSAFDASCLVTRENYAGLIGDYNLPEADRVACQLQRKHGRCNQSHGIGWIARTSDGNEAYIGGDCADRYFGARSEFAQDRARANREIEIDSLLERLRTAHADPNIPQRVGTVLEELRRIHDETRQLIEMLPREVVNSVRRMAKVGSSAVIIEVRHEEPSDRPHEKPTVTWQPQSIGAIRGVAALYTFGLRAIGDEVRAVKSAWDERQLSRATPVKVLRNHAQTMESLPSIEAKLTTAAQAWNAFREQTNLDRCAFLTRDEDEQRRVFKSSRPDASGKAISEAWRIAYKAIVASIENRSFRVP